ncbi:hypothetical protein QVD17_08252 [Tagetes erecta]|uniref:Uncharacterized protein n=1 Tax=Tagetes erecta TaxID=13708 RepID=A0AAD8KZB1_TARER|nr:hypothetical protein QVD17_08252 [Tagetes erecta]
MCFSSALGLPHYCECSGGSPQPSLRAKLIGVPRQPTVPGKNWTGTMIALSYLNKNHNRIWSRGKFSTISKCDYITNNISEAFNSWIGEVSYQSVLDSIREKIMARLDRKRRVLKMEG